MPHSEAWLQGYWDAANWRGFNPRDYSIDEYREGFEAARRRARGL